MYNRYNEECLQTIGTVDFVRQEIADMTGITTETGISVTTRPKDQGIIATGRCEITIIDEAKLRILS